MTANFTRANLNGADLRSVDLRRVVGLEAEQITHAIIDETTQLPEHLQPQWDELNGAE